MDSFNKIDERLEKIADRLGSIDKTLVQQAGNLELHMARTQAAEKRLEHVEDGLVPLVRHVGRVEGAFKLVGAVGILVTITCGIIVIVKTLYLFY